MRLTLLFRVVKFHQTLCNDISFSSIESLISEAIKTGICIGKTIEDPEIILVKNLSGELRNDLFYFAGTVREIVAQINNISEITMIPFLDK